MSDEQAVCNLCGEPMPAGETMFNYHGYSGPCPKPPLPKPVQFADVRAMLDAAKREAAHSPTEDALIDAVEMLLGHLEK